VPDLRLSRIEGEEQYMENLFKKEIYEARFLDPFDQFKEKVTMIEVRSDLFTGARARILSHRWRLPKVELDSESLSKSKEMCPFCAERIDELTPKFSPSLIPDGRISHGQSTVIPNAFPYSLYNAVVIFSEEHYLSLDGFSAEALFDALEACSIYLERVRQADAGVAYVSINWNYMPSAGGGIIHPHLQIVADQKPTMFHRNLLEASVDYHKRHKQTYWIDLVAFEEQESARYIYHYGEATYLSSFCPGGMLGEILILFEGADNFDEVEKEGWRSFSEGLSRILSCLHQMGVEGLNMTLLANLNKEESFRVQARIIPRISFPPLGISDVNYFEKGHNEVITIISPEEFGDKLRSYLR